MMSQMGNMSLTSLTLNTFLRFLRPIMLSDLEQTFSFFTKVWSSTAETPSRPAINRKPVFAPTRSIRNPPTTAPMM